MPSQTIGNVTISGYAARTEGVTYSPPGISEKTGNLYYFNTNTTGNNLTFSSLTAEQVYIFAAAGGGSGNPGSETNGYGGGGGAGGDYLISDLHSIFSNNSQSPLQFSIGSGGGGPPAAGGNTVLISNDNYTAVITINGGVIGIGNAGGVGGTPSGTGGTAGGAGGNGGDIGAEDTSSGVGSPGASITIGSRVIYFGGGGGGGGTSVSGTPQAGGNGGGPGGGSGGPSGSAGNDGFLDSLNVPGSQGGLIDSINGGSGGGGGGGGGYGGGGGGAGISSAGRGEESAAADGAVFLFVVVPSPSAPGQPTLVTRTSTSLTIQGGPGLASGSPFTDAGFRLYDASQNLIKSDVSGNTADASGNFQGIFTGLTANTKYSALWFLINSSGNGDPSNLAPFTTLAEVSIPSAPGVYSLTLVSQTPTTLTIRGNPTGASGSPFIDAGFQLYDSSQNLIQSDASGNTADASGNFQGTFTGLTFNRTYRAKWFLINSAGNGTPSVFETFYMLPPPPTLVSRTSTTLTIAGNSTGASDGPFTDADFKLYSDASGTVFQAEDSSGNTADASGNFQGTLTGLSANTTYFAKWALKKDNSTFYFSNLASFTTESGDPPPPNPPSAPSAPSLLSSTPTTLIVSGNPTDVSGSPFTDSGFRLYRDASGTFEFQFGNSSGPDNSGNYIGIFDTLNYDTDYWVKWYLVNAGGDGSGSSLASFSTQVGSLSAPVGPPILVSRTSGTLTVSGNPTDASGIPTDAGFRLFDPSGIVIIVKDLVSGNTKDSSNNYLATFDKLLANTSYSVNWFLIDGSGNGPESALAFFSILKQAPGEQPILVGSATSTSFEISGNGNYPDVISGRFYLQDEMEQPILNANEWINLTDTGADSSGNFSVIFTNLISNTGYTVKYSLIDSSANETDKSLSSALITTAAVASLPSAPGPGSLIADDPGSTLLTLRGDITDVSGSPFTDAGFRLYRDASGTGLVQEDVSGNIADGIGNYQILFTGLNSETNYWAKWFLINAEGAGPASELVPFSTTVGSLGAPVSPPFIYTATTTSLTIAGNPTDASGTPTDAGFRLYADDSAVSLSAEDVSGNGPDASGNYVASFEGLSSGTAYYFRWFLIDEQGYGRESAIATLSTLAAAPTAPNAPDFFPTGTSLVFTGDPNTATGAPFTSATFFLYSDAYGTSVGDASGTTIDASANSVDSSGNGIDASGNYQASFVGLSYNTTYWFQWVLTNTFGTGEPSALVNTNTSIPTPTVSVTSTSIIASGNATGVNGSPFTSATFFLIDASGIFIDASGTTIDASANGIDGSGNGIDGSGNYQATFSELTPDTPYFIGWYLTNGGGDTNANGILANTLPSASPPTAPGPPILINGTPTSFTVSGDPNTATGTPFTSATFFLYSDSSGTTPVGDASGTTIDATASGIDGSGNGIDTSGNYQATFSELTSNITYWTNWLLTNAVGPGAPSVLESYTAGVPFQPPQLTLFGPSTYSTITVRGSSTGVNNSGSEITSANFYLAVGNGYGSPPVYDASGTTTSDSSGNFTHTYVLLSASTQYALSWSLVNTAGEGPISQTITATTPAICFLRGSKILCINGQKEEYMPIEDMRVGTPVKTLSGAFVKVHTIGKMNFKNPDNADRGPNRLFKLSPKNYPQLTEDLIITGCHSILVDKLEPKQKARHLQLMKNLYMTTGKFRLMAFIDEKAEPYRNPGDHEIWHFALENTEEVCNYGVYANGGLLVESASIKIMRERCGIALIE